MGKQVTLDKNVRITKKKSYAIALRKSRTKLY